MTIDRFSESLAHNARQAARKGDFKALEAILQQGLPPDHKDAYQRSLLNYACASTSPLSSQCVETLFNAGLTREQEGFSYPGALFLSCEDLEGGAAKIRALVAAGWDPRSTIDGATALHWLSQSDGASSSALALIEAGADLNALNDEGYSVLDIAFIESSMDLILTLISQGAQLSLFKAQEIAASRALPDIDALWVAMWEQRQLSLSLKSSEPSLSAPPIGPRAGL